jgi:cyclase
LAPLRRPRDIPQLTYDGEMTLPFDGEHVRLIHPANAHTDAYTITVFERDNVISTVDVFRNGSWPNKGTIDGYIATEKQILSLANDDTLIVPRAWTGRSSC